MVAEIATSVPETTAPKPRVTLAEGIQRWMPSVPGELRLIRRPRPALPGAANRAYLQAIIDLDDCGTDFTGGAEAEAFADRLAARHPTPDAPTRALLGEAMRAYIVAFWEGQEEAYYRGRQDEREGQ